jgi:E3 ubiquitin-protein ligase HUWE1
MKEIINPDLGLFSLSANKFTFQPNRNSEIIPNHLRYFKKIGMLVGKAMKENWLLEINLTKSFLKHILGSTLYVEDL